MDESILPLLHKCLMFREHSCIINDINNNNNNDLNSESESINNSINREFNYYKNNHNFITDIFLRTKHQYYNDILTQKLDFIVQHFNYTLKPAITNALKLKRYGLQFITYLTNTHHHPLLIDTIKSIYILKKKITHIDNILHLHINYQSIPYHTSQYIHKYRQYQVLDYYNKK